jgi:hypothetical protein
MVKLFKENIQASSDEIKTLEMDLEYSTAEKIKSFVWNGSFKGEVYDTYSGLVATLFIIFIIAVDNLCRFINCFNYDG